MSLKKLVSHIGSLATLLLTFSLSHASAQLAVTCTVPTPAQVNVPYLNASCMASGGAPPYTYMVTAGALPGGLSLDQSAGTITGTPSTAGTTFSFTVTATDSTSASAAAPASSLVVNPALTLPCPIATSAVVNVPYTGACSAQGGTPGYVYSISAGSLPPGLGINPSTGAITGIPNTAGSAYAFTVQAIDSYSTPQTVTHAIANFVVGPALSLSCTLPAAEVGVVYATWLYRARRHPELQLFPQYRVVPAAWIVY